MRLSIATRYVRVTELPEPACMPLATMVKRDVDVPPAVAFGTCMSVLNLSGETIGMASDSSLFGLFPDLLQYFSVDFLKIEK